MKSVIPVLTFLRSLGLTEEKILLSINNPVILDYLKSDEQKIFEKFEKRYEEIIPETFAMLSEILTKKEQNIMRISAQNINL